MYITLRNRNVWGMGLPGVPDGHNFLQLHGNIQMLT